MSYAYVLYLLRRVLFHSAFLFDEIDSQYYCFDFVYIDMVEWFYFFAIFITKLAITSNDMINIISYSAYLRKLMFNLSVMLDNKEPKTLSDIYDN